MQLQAEGSMIPKAFIFNTFFWTRLACFGNDFDYSGVDSYYAQMTFFASSKCLSFLLHTCVGASHPKLRAAGVARWTKKVDVFSQDLLIIPINHDSLHWCLATVDMRSRAISYYDSMRGSGLSGMPSCTNDSCPASSTDHAFASCH